MRRSLALLALAALAAPSAYAHGALELNEFDTYVLSDFEGQEDSFPWEGFEIWDIYAGDGYLASQQSHGVYFKGNFAGDGTVRPSGSEEWTLRFNFDVAGQSYERTVTHDGVEVTTDFEVMDWQIADGNVFQVHAWVPVPESEGASIANLVVLSSVDGSPRDIAPGGIYDPATGNEVPVEAPSTPVYPAMGEGRITDEVPLTGASKFLDVEVVEASGVYTFTVRNTLASQGQHFSVDVHETDWTVTGRPNPESLEGGASTTVALTFEAPSSGTIEPVQIDFLTDIGGRQSWAAYVDGSGLHVVDDVALASTHIEEGGKEAPAPSILLVLGALFLARRK